MQRAAILSSAFSLAPPYFSTLSHKRHDFPKKGTEHKMFIFIFLHPLFETFLIVKRNRRDILINVETSSVKYSLFLSDVNEHFLEHIRKKLLKFSLCCFSRQEQEYFARHEYEIY
jgi:hypothetical protein